MDVYSSSRLLDVGDLRVLVTDHGPEDGPVVLMLHGWPDTAHLWRHQIPALVEAGYRVVAPGLRGFGGSDKPRDVDACRVRACVADATAILDDIGADQAHVVAHDWGAAAAWVMALSHPERVRTLVALSIGHPAAFASGGLRQLKASWYMLLFQFEGIAEEFLSRHDWAMFRRFVGDHPETVRWIETLSEPGALTASLNWYRANAHPRRLLSYPNRSTPCTVPVMGLWSDGDVALTEEQMTASADHVAAEWEYHRIEGASHWIPLDSPDELNCLLLDWLARHP